VTGLQLKNPSLIPPFINQNVFHVFLDCSGYSIRPVLRLPSSWMLCQPGWSAHTKERRITVHRLFFPCSGFRPSCLLDMAWVMPR
jgi:hypothetical protein